MPAHTCGSDPAKAPMQWVQDGYTVETLTSTGARHRIPRMVQIQPEWISTTPDGKPFPCQYSNHRTDPACGHCPRRES